MDSKLWNILRCICSYLSDENRDRKYDKVLALVVKQYQDNSEGCMFDPYELRRLYEG